MYMYLTKKRKKGIVGNGQILALGEIHHWQCLCQLKLDLNSTFKLRNLDISKDFTGADAQLMDSLSFLVSITSLKTLSLMEKLFCFLFFKVLVLSAVFLACHWHALHCVTMYPSRTVTSSCNQQAHTRC